MSKKYKSYSKEDKLSLLRVYYQSGLSKKSFCKSRGIASVWSLNTWLKVFANEKDLLSLQSEQANITDMANRSKESYQEENAHLKQRIKNLEKALAFSKLETEARDLMITRAEEYFDIPIRKKIWGQVVMELVEQRNMKVATACRLFGHCRQAFYQSKADIEAEENRDKIILDNVREIRDEDPGIGGYKLWLMLTELYGRELMLYF